MNKKHLLLCCVLALILWLTPEFAAAQPPQDTITSPQQLINAVNQLRVSRGLAPLAEHPALMQSAQSQANYMASTGNVTHDRPGTTYTQQLLALGFPLAGDLSLGGLRSENILSTGAPLVWNGIPDGWQDDQHMNTMLSVNYTHVGAGIAQHDGMYYYALDAAAATGSGQMQNQASAMLTSLPPGSNVSGASQYIIPVELATAQPNGDVYHMVEYGQTLWAIAIQYNTHVKDIQALNNLGDNIVVQQGRKLLVKRGATQPAPVAATPMVMSTPALQIITVTPFVISSPTLEVASLPVTFTPVLPQSTSPASSGSSSSVLVAVLIIAALVGGGVAVWLIRDPNP